MIILANNPLFNGIAPNVLTEDLREINFIPGSIGKEKFLLTRAMYATAS